MTLSPAAERQRRHPAADARPDRDELLAAIRAGRGTDLEMRGVQLADDGTEADEPGASAFGQLPEIIVSMANTGGGRIVLGVLPDGTILGVDPARGGGAERFVLTLATAHCDPPVPTTTAWVSLPDETGVERPCLVVRVRPSSPEFHATRDGHYLLRHGVRCFPMPSDRLGPLLKKRRGRPPTPIEERPVRSCPLSDLDRTRIETYLRCRVPDRSWPADWRFLLRNHGLAVETDLGTIPTLLGLLMFGPHPEEHWQGAYLRMESYRPDWPEGKPADHCHLTGPLPCQIEEAVSYLRVSPLNPTASAKRDTGRFDFPAYSISALHEAVVNAVVHRDYAAPSPVVIRVYSDRIEFRSPGALRDGLTPGHLYTGAPPWRRNQMLAGVLAYHESRTTGGPMMDDRRPGFLTLARESERLSGRLPDVKQPGGMTILTLYAAPVEEQALAARRRP